MPDLAERLQSISAEVAQQHPQYAALAEAFVHRLRQAGAGQACPGVGEPLSPFLLPDTSGQLRSLSELADGKPLVAAFMRGHWCSFCKAQAEALWAAASDVEARGGRIVVITPERARFAAELSSPQVSVLCDVDNGYAASLGLAVAMDPEMAAALQSMGDDVVRFNGGAGWVLPIPATFVLDGAGVIQARFMDPDHRTRMSIEAILTALA